MYIHIPNIPQHLTSGRMRGSVWPSSKAPKLGKLGKDGIPSGLVKDPMGVSRVYMYRIFGLFRIHLGIHRIGIYRVGFNRN